MILSWIDVAAPSRFLSSSSHELCSLPLARSTPACLTVADGIRGLRPTLENLARTTWMKITDGRRLGVPMGETGITDHNMLDLRLEHPILF